MTNGFEIEQNQLTKQNNQIKKEVKVLIKFFILFISVDTCKKRWKYLRERYVQQKKVGGSPASYEHLSRPYLEKMKFLDNFIQSRKSYRQVSQLFQSPSGMQGFDGNESSKSNGSMRLVGGHMNNDLDDTFPQYYLNQFPPHANLRVKSEESLVSDLHRKPNDMQSSNNNMPSSSSSIASQASPATLMSTSTTHDSSVTRKRRRTTSTNISERNNSHNLNHIERTHDSHQNQILNNNHLSDHNSNDDDDDDDASQSSPLNNVPTEFLYPLYEQQSTRIRKAATEHVNPTSSTFPNPVDLLQPLYQHAIARQFRNSDQLLGELVTSELMKMPKDRKKLAQRKILEILFFDDE